LGEHEHPGLRELGADQRGGANTLVGVGRRHADVGHGDVGPVLAHLFEEFLGVARLAHHGKAGVLEDAHDTCSEQERVLGHDHAKRALGHAVHVQGS